MGATCLIRVGIVAVVRAVGDALCDAFSAELLMPRAELAGVRDAEWIAERCDVSLAAARRRVRELQGAG